VRKVSLEFSFFFFDDKKFVDIGHWICQDRSCEKEWENIDEKSLPIIEISRDIEYQDKKKNCHNWREKPRKEKIHTYRKNSQQNNEEESNICIEFCEHLVLEKSVEKMSMRLDTWHLHTRHRRNYGVMYSSSRLTDKYILSSKVFDEIHS